MIAKIKKEMELVNGKMYYKVMLKTNSWFSKWYKEFGSFNQKETDDKYREICKAKNIIQE